MEGSAPTDMETEKPLKQRFDANSTADEVLAGVDLKGKTYLVVGGTSGVGTATVRALAKRGAHVIFTGRNAGAAAELSRHVHLEDSSAQVDFVPLELSSFESVRYFAEKLKAKNIPLHCLVLNAGVFGMPYQQTVDGYESIFQINVLSTMYLLVLLKPLLVEAWSSRVVFLGSESHRFADLTKSNLTEASLSPPQRAYSMWRQYNNGKLQIIAICKYFQERWGKDGITFYAAHPGNMVPTGIGRHWWVWRVLFTLAIPFTKSLEQGAATSTYCAGASELANLGGLYWNNCWMCEPTKIAQDPEFAEMLFPLLRQMIEAKISGEINWD